MFFRKRRLYHKNTFQPEIFLFHQLEKRNWLQVLRTTNNKKLSTNRLRKIKVRLWGPTRKHFYENSYKPSKSNSTNDLRLVSHCLKVTLYLTMRRRLHKNRPIFFHHIDKRNHSRHRLSKKQYYLPRHNDLQVQPRNLVSTFSRGHNSCLRVKIKFRRPMLTRHTSTTLKTITSLS